MTTFNVSKITIVHSSGADFIGLETDLPEGCWPYQGNASVGLYVAYDTAEQYVKDNFPEIIPTVVERIKL